MWSVRFGSVPDMPRKRILPCDFRSWSVVMASLPSSSSCEGLPWNWTTSEVVGLHTAQALLHAGDNILLREDVADALARRRCRAGRLADEAAALRGQEVLRAPASDELADQLLALAVVDRGVDVVDPRVQHRVED
jgi:hypothetical protein